jgi:hypothetical protein
MSLRSAPVFDADGKGTPFLFGQWRRKAPLQPIQSGCVLTREGRPTTYFAALWRAAFPTREPLPDQIAQKDGTGTARFWDVFDG